MINKTFFEWVKNPVNPELIKKQALEKEKLEILEKERRKKKQKEEEEEMEKKKRDDDNMMMMFAAIL
jgi:predicted Zn-dependent peptidase